MFLSNSKSQGASTARRRFLRSTVTCFGALLALVTSDRTCAAKVKSIESFEKSGNKGYQETDHVRRYYDTARM